MIIHQVNMQTRQVAWITNIVATQGPRPVSDIPALTSANDARGYIVTGTPLWTGSIWDYWSPYATPSAGLNGFMPSSIAPVNLDIQIPVAKVYNQFSWCGNENQYGRIASFRLQGSNDGNTWTDLTSVSGITAASYVMAYGTHLIVPFNNYIAYTRYRIQVDSILINGSGNWTPVHIEEVTWSTRLN